MQVGRKRFSATYFSRLRFFKNILLYMSSRLSKLRSVHMYVMPWTVYFGWICSTKTMLVSFWSFWMYLSFEPKNFWLLLSAYSQFNKIERSTQGSRKTFSVWNYRLFFTHLHSAWKICASILWYDKVRNITMIFSIYLFLCFSFFAKKVFALWTHGCNWKVKKHFSVILSR